MDASWLTEATSPWWSAPVATLATLAVGNYFTNRSTDRVRAANATENEVARTHAETLADKQQAATLQAQESERADARKQAAVLAAAEACASALEAIAVLRANLAASAVIDNSEPVPAQTVSDFISSVSKARLLTQAYFPTLQEIIEAITKYLHDWPAATLETCRATVVDLDAKLEDLADQVTDAYDPNPDG